MAARNVNTYDIVVRDRNGSAVCYGAGKVVNAVLTTLWDGTGASVQGAYIGILTVRNNCGEKIEKTLTFNVIKSILS